MADECTSDGDSKPYSDSGCVGNGIQPLKFITFTNPLVKPSKEERRAVSSHVARVHHSTNAKEKSKRAALEREYKRRKARKAQVTLNFEVFDTNCLQSEHRPDTYDVGSDHSDSSEDASLLSQVLDSDALQRKWDESSCTLTVSDRVLGGGHSDPFWTYPLSKEPFIPRLIDHYLVHMAVNVPELDLGVPGMLRQSWFRFVMADPTAFHTVILLAASSYVSLYGVTKDVPDLVHLRQRAIRSVLNDLKNQRRRETDHLVSAVVKLACHEAIYGTYDTYIIHMTAVAELILQRGGLGTLGLNGLLKRMCLWVESNAAFLHNSPRQFFMGQGLIPPNPHTFIGPEWKTRMT